MIDLAVINNSKWFKYDEKNKKDTEKYKIRFMTEEKFVLLCNRNNIDINSQEIKESDIDKLIETAKKMTPIAMEAVEDWKGITMNGKPSDCNNQNKEILFKNFPYRTLFVIDKCRNEKYFLNGKLEEDLKN